MKSLYFLLAFAFLTAQNFSAQIINVPVQNFSLRDYGKVQSSQNWCVAQDKQGLIYFGNANGILQYDGRSWQFIPVKQGAYVTALSVDSAGTIFVGSQHEFGFLEPDFQGKLIYQSLSSALKGNDKEFTTIVKVYSLETEIYFQSQEKIFIYRKNTPIKTLSSSVTFHTSFVVNNTFYVRERKKGLLKYVGGVLEKVKGGERFEDMGIFCMIPFNNTGEILIGTMEIGLWKYSPNADNEDQIFQPFKISDEAFIRSCGLYGGIKLSNGQFAFNTLNEGVFLMNQDGEIVSKINKEMGLRVNDVKYVLEDDQQNLWIALNNGISKVPYNSPLSYYTDEAGLTGSVHSVIKEKQFLYIATSGGLYYWNENDRTEKYSRMSDINNQIWFTLKVNDVVFAGGDEGIYRLDGDKASRVSTLKCRTMAYDSIHKIWLVGNEQGLFILNSSWQVNKRIDDVNDQIVSVKLSVNEQKDIDVWAGTLLKGVYRIYLDKDLNTMSEWIGLPEGLSNECIYPFHFNRQIVFGSSAGVFSFIDKGRFELLPLIDGLVFEEQVNVLYSYKDNVWFAINNRVVQYDRKANKGIEIPFLPIDKGMIHCFFQEGDVCWIGSDDALIKYDLNKTKSYDEKFPVKIRKISCGKDSILYYGNGDVSLQSGSARLEYNYNSMSFEYSSLFYEEGYKNLYSYKLEGQDTSWSKWSTETKAVFTNLHEGRYTFFVKSKNIYGAQSNIDNYSFVISAPWYRTWWAYSGYVFGFTVGVFGFIRNRTRKLRNEKIRLERIVEERTAEISKQKNVIEKQKHLVEEKHKEITDSINYAERIQKSFLATKEVLNENLKDHFVFFQPKDVVSGDFYWASKLNNGQFALATADSTGHGVPGAIMSLLNITSLEKASEHHSSPSAILNETRKTIIERLKKDGSAEGGKDGMDCSLISFDFSNNKLSYAAANNSVWVVRANELIELNTDKMPVGKHDKDNVPFHQHEFELQKGDVVYTLTDGFPDQFGGEKGKKFMSKRLKELLQSISHFDLTEQKRILEETFSNWVGNLEQVDDVTVIGIKV
jgi:serine phosphatase RsbU (regulator of sigma subunit)